MRSQIVAGLLLVVIAFTSAAAAQTATGSANGSVTDQSGAVIPGASIKLTNEATGVETVAITNETGYYVFVGVQPGTYTLRVTMAGFRSLEARGLQVGVNQTVTQNFSVEVGGVSETVEVTLDSPMIN